MKYRKRITLWAAVIAIGTVTAVSIIERLRAYKIADIITDEAAWDAADSLSAAAVAVSDSVETGKTDVTANGVDCLADKDVPTVKSPTK